MTKMEAVGHLCKIKGDKKRELKACEELIWNDDADQDPRHQQYHVERVEELKLLILALEMAGAAMTR